jgi:hypothetical protein
LVDLSSQAGNDLNYVRLAFRYVRLSAPAAPDNAVDAAAVDARPFARAVDAVAPEFGQFALQRHAPGYSLRAAAEVYSSDSVESSVPPELVLWPGGANEGHEEVGELAEAQEVLGWLWEW